MATKYIICKEFFGGIDGSLDNINTVSESLEVGTIALLVHSSGDYRYELKEASDTSDRTTNYPEVSNNVNIIHDDSSTIRYWECIQSPKLDNLISNAGFDLSRTKKYVSRGSAISVSSIASGVCTTTNTQGLAKGSIVALTGSGTLNANATRYAFEVINVVSNTSFTIHDKRVDDHNISDTYVPGVITLYSGTFYLCIRTHSNQTPPNVIYWTALSSTDFYEVDLQQEFKACMWTTGIGQMVLGEYSSTEVTTNRPSDVKGRGLKLVCDGNGSNNFRFLQLANPGDTGFSVTYSDFDGGESGGGSGKPWTNFGIGIFDDDYFTLGCWISGTNAYLSLDTDLDTEVTSVAKSGLTWHEITIKTSANIQKFIAQVKSSSSTLNEVDYISKPMLVRGRRIRPENWLRKPNDIIFLLDSTLKSSFNQWGFAKYVTEAYEVDIQTDFDCSVSRNVQELCMNVILSGDDSTGDRVILSNWQSQNRVLLDSTSGTGAYEYSNNQSFLSAQGGLNFQLATKNSTTVNASYVISGVLIR